MKAGGAALSMTTLSLEEMRKRNPKNVFMHLRPGTVPDTGLVDRPEHIGRWLRMFFRAIVPVMRISGYTVEESGEKSALFGDKWKV
ncbi:hypothetical protein GJ744_012432 [Endocarpon pusillum]|uniref:Uncharacterized protein n=1 Tax=Endocarpon pusillum TaxID=364733 RepID=A0A8H7AF21_9EURO|nr:hypothetical protein GJ744_012432 [Endocarpon pusillum]